MEEKRVCTVAQRDYLQWLLFHWFLGKECGICTCQIINLYASKIMNFIDILSIKILAGDIKIYGVNASWSSR